MSSKQNELPQRESFASPWWIMVLVLLFIAIQLLAHERVGRPALIWISFVEVLLGLGVTFLVRRQNTGIEERLAKLIRRMHETAVQLRSSAGDFLAGTRQQERGAGRIAEFNAHNQRVAGLSEVLMELANKVDLLALNAALEGTKAGEAGRGFSLVANQMQKLAETAMGSVREVKEITRSVTSSTSPRH